MAEERRGEDIVSEYLGQNPHLAQWVESFRGYCETNKQWSARREFILRNMEAFPTIEPGIPSSSLDRLLSLSMVWANNVFLGCRYPQAMMVKIKDMGEGVVVEDAPVRTTRDEIIAKGKRSASSGQGLSRRPYIPTMGDVGDSYNAPHIRKNRSQSADNIQPQLRVKIPLEKPSQLVRRNTEDTHKDIRAWRLKFKLNIQKHSHLGTHTPRWEGKYSIRLHHTGTPHALLKQNFHGGEAPDDLSAVRDLEIFDLSCFMRPDGDGGVKKAKAGPNEGDGRSAGRAAARPACQKPGPSPQAPAQHQPFFNRLYKAVAWKLVSAGGFGPNLDHHEILQSCVESCKQSLSCVFVPLKDIPDLPASRAQKEGQVCELRCSTVYMGTGYGRDESAARAMASKEALKAFQGRKVTVKICRRRYKGTDVEDVMLLDDQPRSQGFPPALSYPFQADLGEDGAS